MLTSKPTRASAADQGVRPTSIPKLGKLSGIGMSRAGCELRDDTSFAKVLEALNAKV